MLHGCPSVVRMWVSTIFSLDTCIHKLHLPFWLTLPKVGSWPGGWWGPEVALGDWSERVACGAVYWRALSCSFTGGINQSLHGCDRSAFAIPGTALVLQLSHRPELPEPNWINKLRFPCSAAIRDEDHIRRKRAKWAKTGQREIKDKRDKVG